MVSSYPRIEEKVECGRQDLNFSCSSQTSIGEPYLFRGNRIGTLYRNLRRLVLEKRESQIFRLYNAWSIETVVLMDLISHGINDIRIILEKPDGSRILYRTAPEFWLRNSIIDKFRIDQNPTAYMRVSLFERFMGV